MGSLLIAIFLSLLKTVLLFVPEDEYRAKVAHIQSMDRKNVGVELNGWEYRRTHSVDSTYLHRYYYFPSERDSAPALVFLHGMSLDGRNFLRMKPLAEQWELFAYDFPEISPEFTGHIDDFVRLLGDFMDAAGIDSALVAGVSFGGAVGVRAAGTSLSSRIPALVLISSPLVGRTEHKRTIDRKVDAWLHSLPDYKVYWLLEKVQSRFRRQFDGVEQKQIEAIIRIKNIAFYRQVMSSFRGYDACEDAAAVERPVLVLQGTADKVVSPKEAPALGNAVAASTVQMIQGGTHAMAYLKGREIAARISRWHEGRGHRGTKQKAGRHRPSPEY